MAVTPHVHKCMSCGESWECPIPGDCLAQAKVLPSIILKGPNGPQVFDHSCQRKPAPVSETSTPASDAAQRILQLTKALEQSVRVVRDWHAMPKKPGDDDAFDLYFNHSPEMKLIRDALGKIPEYDA